MYASYGSDTVYGGDGDDTIDARDNSSNPGQDTIWGGRGNDTILADDGQKDIINCGRGANDTVTFDQGLDEVADNCEIKKPEDRTAPTISNMPSDITEEATGASGARVSYTSPTANDDIDGAVDVICTPASDSTFPIGTTEVTCSAKDKAGNEATGGFNVTVHDTTAPTISEMPSDITEEATGVSGAKVSYTSPTAEDSVDGDPSVSCSPESGSTFPIETTLVTCSATDKAGNSATDSFKVTVILPVLVGAGDIAVCSSAGNDEGTADLLDGIDGTVFTTGDNAYESGTDAEYRDCYEPTWGRHKARTKPTPGNHEYYTEGASGYFNYFGAAAGDPSKGYYSYDIGDWHIVALNGMCEGVGGCEADSPMVRWLKEDLAANSKSCTLAYWHHPLFSSGEHGNHTKMKPSWDALYAADAEVVLNGHDHDYERFAPQNSSGAADPARGIREFVVGTGGSDEMRAFGTIKPNSEIRNAGTYGVLKLSLYQARYDWEFVPVAGQTFTDSGSDSCH